MPPKVATESCSTKLRSKASPWNCYPNQSCGSSKLPCKAAVQRCSSKLLLIHKAAPPQTCSTKFPKLLPKAPPQSGCPKAVAPKLLLQTCSPKRLPKAILQSGSRKLLPKVATESCSPKLRSKASPQSCCSKLPCKAAPQSCSPKRFPAAASLWGPPQSGCPKAAFKPVCSQSGSPKLFSKAAPESCSAKLLPKAAPQSCVLKLVPKTAPQSCGFSKLLFEAAAQAAPPSCSCFPKLLHKAVPQLLRTAAPQSC